MEKFEKIEMHNVDCVEFIQTLPDGSIDVICIDPPYLYLKNQKLERPFDELTFFYHCWRVLKDKGFIVMFGRGVSFYRWNCILNDLGMTFKEEIVWDKNFPGSPNNNIQRTHESCVIYSRGTSTINKVHIDYIEQKKHDFDKIIGDLNRLKSIIRNPKDLDSVNEYLLTRMQKFNGYKRPEFISGSGMNQNNPTVGVIKMISEGMIEKTIIKVDKDRYSRIHPTQKPVRLLERLLALVIPDKPREDIVVADFFAGSMSCMEAVYRMNMTGIACEIDEEYYSLGVNRIKSLPPKQTTLNFES